MREGEIDVWWPRDGVPRKPRVEVAGGVCHVYARGNNHCELFIDDDDRRRYLAILGSVVEDARWRCLAYCLMSNHVHFLIETTEANLGAGMRRFHSFFAQFRNRRPHGPSRTSCIIFFALYGYQKLS